MKAAAPRAVPTRARRPRSRAGIRVPLRRWVMAWVVVLAVAGRVPGGGSAEWEAWRAANAERLARAEADAERDAALLARLTAAAQAVTASAPTGDAPGGPPATPHPPAGPWEVADVLRGEAGAMEALLASLSAADATLLDDLAEAAGFDVAAALRAAEGTTAYLLRRAAPEARSGADKDATGPARAHPAVLAGALVVATEDSTLFSLLAHDANTAGPVELTGVRRARLRRAIPPLFPFAPLVAWDGRWLVVALDGALLEEFLALTAAPAPTAASAPATGAALRPGGLAAVVAAAARAATLPPEERVVAERVMIDLETIDRANRLWAMLPRGAGAAAPPSLEELHRALLLFELPTPPPGLRYEQAATRGAYPRCVEAGAPAVR